jgi:glycosyltransferase involved in cell wall biosynthesis
VVQNAVDTSGLAEVDIPKRTGRCIYVGSLYESKRLPFLLEAADSIAANVPHFELIVVGDGPLRPWLQSEAEIRPWLHQEGPSHGVQRDRLFASSELTLVPGSVGLVVVDSFAARAPLVTVHEALHGPEIEYLQEGVNGRVIEFESVENYAGAVTQLLVDRALREKLADGCARSSKKYTVEAMATNFASGIVAALDMPGARRERELG